MVESFQTFGNQVLGASLWGAGLAVGLGLVSVIVWTILTARDSR